MTNHTHVTTPAPLDPSDPRLKGPSREALVRAWPVIMRQVAVCEARALQRTAALLTDYDAAHRMLREEEG